MAHYAEDAETTLVIENCVFAATGQHGFSFSPPRRPPDAALYEEALRALGGLSLTAEERELVIRAYHSALKRFADASIATSLGPPR